MGTNKVTLRRLAAHVAGRLEGPDNTEVSGIAELALAGPQELSFLINKHDLETAKTTKAAAVLGSDSLAEVSLPMVWVSNVPEAINLVLELFAQSPELDPGIHPSATIAPDAILGTDLSIGPNVVVQDRTTVGDGSVLQAGCYLGRDCLVGQQCRFAPGVIVSERSEIGNRVVLGENVVIGSQGFGYRCRDGQHRHIPHLGAVRIGDEVEIGAGTCIDRAKFGFTVIGRGTKIDNLVSIAHNVRVGEYCLIAAQTGIAGSAVVGNRVVFGGQVGVRDNITVADGVIAGARAAIHHDLPPGIVVLGMPALERRQALREQAVLRRLPHWPARIKKLEQRLTDLESAADHRQRD